MNTTLTFPRVEGTTLDGQAVTLPDGFASDKNLVIVAFGRAQQADGATWAPVADYLAGLHPGLAVYRLPVLGRLNAVARFGLEQAMRAMARDANPMDRARAVPLYIDQQEFCRAVGLPGPDQLAVLLVDRAARVCWRGRGPYTSQEQVGEIEGVLATI